MRLDVDRKTLLGMLAGAAITVIVVVLLRGLFGGGEGPSTPIEDIRPRSADTPASQIEEDDSQVKEDDSQVEEDVAEFTASQEPPDIAVPTGKGMIDCPEATVTVADATELVEALEAAEPGTVIRLEPGVYAGRFVAAISGTEADPIFVCGPPEAIIDGGGVKKGYAFHLNQVDHWRLIGFTVRNSQKGVMADQTNNTIIQGLTVHHIGDEAIHLRNFSSDNTVQYCMIYATGLRREKFGEGVYLGTAESNWAAFSGGKMDRSDRNIVRGNVIRSTAEAIDIKEGTSDGHIVGNIFDGSGLGGSKHNDSWVDVKGNGYLIQGNTGRSTNADGFQTHKIVDGWGTRNVFRANIIDLGDSGGVGINDTAGGNTIACDNKVTGGMLTKKDVCS
ncbi:right-handed parallel beta-helix repeat-containing protein [Streptosporangium sp. NBC_01810]|uniref:right-handed parallel beta-helix repeat-containing protein n=1 Tax=Streptosporangium sp. NBC_01810 TaxID=2975951 RepID=UPI002DDB8404|nr:right-handed parallel beta-helix repeat-containing protein [Streptosporangium sp. NBC_01810]WSA24717.1 right-handed parallel beta-helix repeat-containing protein [Streptosporangium sp. NBC_01810]